LATCFNWKLFGFPHEKNSICFFHLITSLHDRMKLFFATFYLNFNFRFIFKVSNILRNFSLLF
jgi:hypothetical protein